MAEEEEQTTSQANKEKQKEAKGVDSVTDYVQEKDNAQDAAKTQEALTALGSSSSSSSSSSSASSSAAKAPAALKDEDLKLLAEECEISREAAEALLKAHEGDLHKAMTAFVRGEAPRLR